MDLSHDPQFIINNNNSYRNLGNGNEGTQKESHFQAEERELDNQTLVSYSSIETMQQNNLSGSGNMGDDDAKTAIDDYLTNTMPWDELTLRQQEGTLVQHVRSELFSFLGGVSHIQEMPTDEYIRHTATGIIAIQEHIRSYHLQFPHLATDELVQRARSIFVLRIDNAILLQFAQQIVTATRAAPTGPNLSLTTPVTNVNVPIKESSSRHARTDPMQAANAAPGESVSRRTLTDQSLAASDTQSRSSGLSGLTLSSTTPSAPFDDEGDNVANTFGVNVAVGGGGGGAHDAMEVEDLALGRDSGDSNGNMAQIPSSGAAGRKTTGEEQDDEE